MKYHALLVIFQISAKFRNSRLLQIIGGALRVNCVRRFLWYSVYASEALSKREEKVVRIYTHAPVHAI